MTSLEEKLISRWPVSRWTGLTLTIGVSGGADSVALLRALHRLQPPTTKLIVVHFNHGLRATESDGDACFVSSLAEQLGLPFHCNQVLRHPIDSMEANRTAEVPQIGVPRDEASLRRARYDYLEQVSHQVGSRYLVTAHSMDDQAETVLFQLLRGSGTSMTGIRPFRELRPGSDLVLARPILDVSRIEIEEYLTEMGQSFRHDRSNDCTDYSRNWIRRELLPMIETRIKNARQALARSATTMLEFTEWNEDRAIELFGVVLRPCQNGGLDLLIEQAALQPWFTLQAAMRLHWKKQNWPLGEMTHRHWQTIRAALDRNYQGERTWNLPGNLTLERTANELQIRNHRDSSSEEY